METARLWLLCPLYEDVDSFLVVKARLLKVLAGWTVPSPFPKRSKRVPALVAATRSRWLSPFRSPLTSGVGQPRLKL